MIDLRDTKHLFSTDLAYNISINDKNNYLHTCILAEHLCMRLQLGDRFYKKRNCKQEYRVGHQFCYRISTAVFDVQLITLMTV